jgi:hypothetical protein
MTTTWALLIVSAALLLTRAKYLAYPYIAASCFFLFLDYFHRINQWEIYVATMMFIDFMCFKYFQRITSTYSRILKVLLLSGVVLHFLLGVDYYFDTSIVYIDRYQMYVKALNVFQIITLILGGYGASMANRKRLVDWRYSYGDKSVG